MEDKLIVEILDSKYAQARNNFRDGNASHEDLTIMMLKHQTNHIAHLEVDMSNECKDVRNEINDVCQEMHTEFKDVRNEINGLRQEIKAVSNKNLTIIGLMLVVMTAVVTIVLLLNK